MAKVVGSVFALIIAPIIAGLAINYSQKVLDGPKPDAEKAESKGPATSSSEAKPEVAQPKPKAIVAANTPDVTKVLGRNKRALAKSSVAPSVHLFNDKDLTGFQIAVLPPLRLMQPVAKGKSKGRGKASDEVFTVRDSAIHTTGQSHAALIADGIYDNYHLHLKYRWGEKTWYTGEAHPRSACIMIHATLVNEGRLQRLEGVRCHLSSAGWTGDLNLFDPQNKALSMTATATERSPGETKKAHAHLTYSPGAPNTTVTTATIHRFEGDRGSPKADGLPRPVNWEHPLGRWNTLEIVCVGDAIRVIVNGRVLNHVTKVGLTKGAIAFVAEGAEIDFDDVRMTAMERLPE
jgi:hypothetical protein